MKVTLNRLYELGAPLFVIKEFVAAYPNGASISEIYRNQNLSELLIFFVHDHFNETNPSDNLKNEDLVLKRLNIKESQYIYHSSNIEKSSNIFECSSVVNSNMIYNSCFVVNSNLVSNSQNIEEGSAVFNSSFITSSEKVCASENVFNSLNIAKTVACNDSQGVISSRNISNSSNISNCNDMDKCHVCESCSNLTDSMFCFGAREGKFLIFNKPTNETFYNHCANYYNKIRNLINIMEIDVDNASCKLINNLSKRYESFSPTFIKWIKTLPNFDEDLFYKITLMYKI